MVLALCIAGVTAVTFLLIALVDRPKEQPEHLERIADEASYCHEAPVLVPAHRESRGGGRRRQS